MTVRISLRSKRFQGPTPAVLHSKSRVLCVSFSQKHQSQAFSTQSNFLPFSQIRIKFAAFVEPGNIFDSLFFPNRTYLHPCIICLPPSLDRRLRLVGDSVRPCDLSMSYPIEHSKIRGNDSTLHDTPRSSYHVPKVRAEARRLYTYLSRRQ